MQGVSILIWVVTQKGKKDAEKNIGREVAVALTVQPLRRQKSPVYIIANINQF